MMFLYKVWERSKESAKEKDFPNLHVKDWKSIEVLFWVAHLFWYNLNFKYIFSQLRLCGY